MVSSWTASLDVPEVPPAAATGPAGAPAGAGASGRLSVSGPAIASSGSCVQATALTARATVARETNSVLRFMTSLH